MSTINVLDAAGATQTVQAPNPNGRAAAALSRPVALSTEDLAALGTLALDATLAALSAKLPASLGAKAGAASLSTVAATDDYARLPAASCSVLLTAAATTNATSVKGSAGALKSIQGYNAKAAAVFLKFYDKASAPTVGTDTPVKVLYVPATSAFVFDFPSAFKFVNGIAYAITGASPNADTTALVSGDVLCLNVDYI